MTVFYIKIKDMILPTPYYRISDAMDAVKAQRAKGCGVMPEIIHRDM